ncbi:hypothetical protein MHK_003445 [Candidatus Magnetomorum sp. HK-1]|nr:hypothetical protein MHK_003445 [Candidatus Magnetomorum sp. HK-1]
MQKYVIIKMIEVVCIVLTLTSLTFAVPMQINYQGFLTNENDIPINETVKKITFRLYSQAENGEAFWIKTHYNVLVVDGVYNVLLGDFSSDQLSDELYLGVTIEEDEELKPRQKITSVLFAIKAKEAETVADGAITTNKIAKDAVTSDKIANNAVSIEKIQHGPDSGLNADLLDGKDSNRFALKEECIQKDQDTIHIKEIKPNSIPLTSNSLSGQLYAKSAGVDFNSENTIVQGLVLYWKMDDDNSDIIKDYVASSDGTAISVPEIVAGKIGNARQFNGKKGQYIIKKHDPLMDFGTYNFSISFWIKADKPTNWTIIMGKANGRGNDEDYGWLFGNTGGQDSSDLTRRGNGKLIL